MNNMITIVNTTVRMDEDGRYCLNDIHKASGGEDRHAPNRFFRLDSTIELMYELSNCPEMGNCISSKAGRYGGTFVVEDLVYAYAMWISPSFHLKVIRDFKRLNTRGVAVADHAVADFKKNPLKYMRELLEQAEEIEAKLAIAQPKADAFDANCALNGENLTRFTRSLPMVNSMMIKKDLERSKIFL